MFNVFNKDLGNDSKHTQRKFTDDTKLGGLIDTLRGRADIQRDTDKMEEWFNRSLMKVKGKTQSPAPEIEKSQTIYRLEANSYRVALQKRTQGPGGQQIEHVIVACQ